MSRCHHFSFGRAQQQRPATGNAVSMSLPRGCLGITRGRHRDGEVKNCGHCDICGSTKTNTLIRRYIIPIRFIAISSTVAHVDSRTAVQSNVHRQPHESISTRRCWQATEACIRGCLYGKKVIFLGTLLAIIWMPERKHPNGQPLRSTRCTYGYLAMNVTVKRA